MAISRLGGGRSNPELVDGLAGIGRKVVPYAVRPFFIGPPLAFLKQPIHR